MLNDDKNKKFFESIDEFKKIVLIDEKKIV